MTNYESNSILNYQSESDYYHYLEGLDKNDLLNEFYACNRLKKEIESKIDKVCRTVYNQFCTLLVDIDCKDITRFDCYLLRILLRFELFVKHQSEYINKIHDLHDVRPIHTIKPSAFLNALSVLGEYSKVMQQFRRLEKLVFSFEERTNMWMYFLYGRRDIPETLKTEECRRKICAVESDGTYDFRSQREYVYKELVRIIETEMNCDISVFMDKRSWT